MSTHARLSASGSTTWINCAGSVAAQDGIEDKGSAFAQEGTDAHELGELCLRDGFNASEFVGKPLVENPDCIVTVEMADYVQDYVDYVRSLDGELMIEERVDYSGWVPGGFGTSDAIVIKEPELIVTDLKFGQGIKVYAKENTQGILYALGAYDLVRHIYSIETVRIVIHQPRLDHVDEWMITVDELLSWGAFLQVKAEEALEPDAPRTPGEKQCQWCKAKPTCPALAEHTRKIIASDFDDCEPVAVQKLTIDQMAEALANKKLIISWLDAIEAVATERLKNGESFPGYKLVAGRSSRDWADDESVIANRMIENMGVERDALYTQTFITPAAAEKLVGKKKAALLEELIVKSDGKPTMVPDSDKRPALGITADDFDEVGDD